LKKIVCHGELANEESLFELLSKRISSSNDDRFFDLLEFVHLEFLPMDCFARYFDLVSDHVSQFTVSHWNSLSTRFLLDSRAENDRCGYQSIRYESSQRFYGIVSCLTERCNGNVHDRGVVSVTANRVYNNDPTYAPKNVVDLENDSFFYSTNDEGQPICLDFRQMKVKPTHYSIRTNSEGKNGGHLKSWVIEGSLDGNSWTVVDQWEINDNLNNSFGEHAFAVTKLETFRMVQLRQTTPNHLANNHIYLTKLEIFSWLIGLK
jgi:hypothetical protein